MDAFLEFMTSPIGKTGISPITGTVVVCLFLQAKDILKNHFCSKTERADAPHEPDARFERTRQICHPLRLTEKNKIEKPTLP